MENVILNGNDITHLVTSFEVYEEMDNEHIIGNAVSTQIKIKLRNKDIQLTDQLDYPFYIGNKAYIVYEKPEKWTGVISLTLYDKMILANRAYDTNIEYPSTVSEQLDEMSAVIGLDIDKSTLSEAVLEKEVKWYDSSMIMRKYLGFIAQCDGKNVYIEGNSIVFRPIATTSHSISFCSGYELNESITFTRICYDNGVTEPLEKGTDIGKTLYVSKENSYIEQSDIDRIYEMYNGLSFYSFKQFRCRDIDGISLTDLVVYHDITVLPFSIKRTVHGGSAKDSLEMSGDITIANADTVIVKEDVNLKIRRIQATVDQNEATMEIIAQQSSNNADEIGKLLVSTDEIRTEVKKKVGEDEIISKINQTAEAIKILAKFIQLEGIITANGNITIHEDGSLEAKNGKFTGKIEGSSFVTKNTMEFTYTEDDIDIMRNIVDLQLTPSDEQLKKYDLDNNGIINSKDYSTVSGIIRGYYGGINGIALIEDIIEINTVNSGKIVTYRKINGEETSRLAINSGSISTYGGGITVDGEPVITAISGTVARFG